MWRLEGERKAYESEEITTKAADWRKWIRCDDGIHVMSEIMVMTMGKVVIVVVVGGPNQRKDRQYDRARNVTPRRDWETQCNGEWERRVAKRPWEPPNCPQRGE